MPVAPRSNKKAKKIAEQILGVPSNQKKQTNVRRNKRLLDEETKLSR